MRTIQDQTTPHGKPKHAWTVAGVGRVRGWIGPVQTRAQEGRVPQPVLAARPVARAEDLQEGELLLAPVAQVGLPVFQARVHGGRPRRVAYPKEGGAIGVGQEAMVLRDAQAAMPVERIRAGVRRDLDRAAPLVQTGVVGVRTGRLPRPSTGFGKQAANFHGVAPIPEPQPVNGCLIRSPVADLERHGVRVRVGRRVGQRLFPPHPGAHGGAADDRRQEGNQEDSTEGDAASRQRLHPRPC